jgi:hypothetical protein
VILSRGQHGCCGKILPDAGGAIMRILVSISIAEISIDIKYIFSDFHLKVLLFREINPSYPVFTF